MHIKEINPKTKFAVNNNCYYTFDLSYILTQIIITKMIILLIVNNIRLDNSLSDDQVIGTTVYYPLYVAGHILQNPF